MHKTRGTLKYVAAHRYYTFPIFIVLISIIKLGLRSCRRVFAIALFRAGYQFLSIIRTSSLFLLERPGVLALPTSVVSQPSHAISHSRSGHVTINNRPANRRQNPIVVLNEHANARLRPSHARHATINAYGGCKIRARECVENTFHAAVPPIYFALFASFR